MEPEVLREQPSQHFFTKESFLEWVDKNPNVYHQNYPSKIPSPAHAYNQAEPTTQQSAVQNSNLPSNLPSNQGSQQTIQVPLGGTMRDVYQNSPPTLDIPASQYQILYRLPISTHKKVVALTFDDGPWPQTTDQILHILDQEHVKATFFMVGKYLVNFPAIAKRVAAKGHAIGNHSWTHSYHFSNPLEINQELNRTQQLIFETTQITPTLFRPPGGYMKNGMVTQALQKNFSVIMWDVDPRDWQATSHQIRNRIIQQTKPGSILLLHDGGGNRSPTVSVLREIIRTLKDQGYEFVTLPYPKK